MKPSDMERNELEQLLDGIYELEGLVHLALSRDDLPADLRRLIARKGEMLSSLVSGMYAGEEDKPLEYSLSPETEVLENPEITESYFREESSVTEPEEREDNREMPVEEKGEMKTDGAAPKGRLVFTVNDRYRFKKDLFRGSDADFNNTLALVASMESFDEAEDYFLNELQWDAGSAEVGDFLDVIKRYYK